MAAGIKDQVAILGVGCTKFGDNFHQGYEEMALEAAEEACRDAGCALEEIPAAWLGTYSPSYGWGKSGTSLADALRFYGKPITRVENYCATGTDAFRNAAFAVAAGVYDLALVVGVEKYKDRPTRGLAREAPHPFLAEGYSAPGAFALGATRYLNHFGVGREALAKVAVKNHHNGSLNPKAHFQMEVSEQQVLSAPIIAWPFGLLDCCPTTDGAAAAVIGRIEEARRRQADFVRLEGVGLAVTSGRPFLDPQFDYLGFRATQLAAQQAYQMAGISNPRRELSLAEVHDCFTWTEICNYEDLGFCKKGDGPALIASGATGLQGEIPVNPSGGLKSFGHPIGASGLRMIYEVSQQLRGRAGPRQVPQARRGLVHNLGGPGAVSCVLVLAA